MAWENSAIVASGPNDASVILSGSTPLAPATEATIDGVAWGTGLEASVRA